MPTPSWKQIPLLILLLAACGVCESQAKATQLATTASTQGPDRGAESFELFPKGEISRPYLADPHRPQFALQLLAFSDPGIDDSGSLRTALKTGGRLGLVRWSSQSPTTRRWQLSLEAGFDSQFDVDHSLDSIGWDGNYGLTLTTAEASRAWKLSVFHTSSHVGDEYAERTGRRRVGYTREEVQVGFAWSPDSRWRTYLECGWGYGLRTESVQAPGRAQVGAEFVNAGRWWGGRLGWFAAADLQAMEERDWRPEVALQAGYFFPAGGSTWRAGVEILDGRPPMGEFYQDEETYVSLGVWMDL